MIAVVFHDREDLVFRTDDLFRSFFIAPVLGVFAEFAAEQGERQEDGVGQEENGGDGDPQDPQVGTVKQKESQDLADRPVNDDRADDERDLPFLRDMADLMMDQHQGKHAQQGHQNEQEQFEHGADRIGFFEPVVEPCGQFRLGILQFHDLSAGQPVEGFECGEHDQKQNKADDRSCQSQGHDSPSIIGHGKTASRLNIAPSRRRAEASRRRMTRFNSGFRSS